MPPSGVDVDQLITPVEMGDLQIGLGGRVAAHILLRGFQFPQGCHIVIAAPCGLAEFLRFGRRFGRGGCRRSGWWSGRGKSLYGAGRKAQTHGYAGLRVVRRGCDWSSDWCRPLEREELTAIIGASFPPSKDQTVLNPGQIIPETGHRPGISPRKPGAAWLNWPGVLSGCRAEGAAERIPVDLIRLVPAEGTRQLPQSARLALFRSEYPPPT